MWKKLGLLLRRERKASGLSMKEVVKRSGITENTLWSYERAANQGGISLRNFTELCRVIGADPAQLLAEAMVPDEESRRAEARATAQKLELMRNVERRNADRIKKWEDKHV